VWKRESIEQKFDRMAEADRRRRIRKLRKEESAWNKLKTAFSYKTVRQKPFRVRDSTRTYENIYHYHFEVPAEVYSNKEYREKLNKAKTVNEVEYIINSYYKHH
jgi:GTP1/Obg family GTP-binding protein